MSTPELCNPTDALEGCSHLLNLSQELEQANRARREFLIGASHRFRTPLNGVMGMLELLANSTLEEGQLEFVESALDSGRAMMRVFDELIDFCRAEAGELSLVRKTYSPSQVASSVIAEFTPEAVEKGIELGICASPEVPATIEGDPSRLYQVLHELVENAMRFTGEGRIQVGIRPGLDETEGDTLQFWVEDTGEGMPEEKLGGLFELQLGVSEGDGLNIGLPAVRHILDAMGGTIELESTPGHGTTAHFSVPTAAPTTADLTQVHVVPEEQRALDKDRRTARVLVVEDDMVNQRVALGYLKLAGYEGFVVDSGEAALEALSRDSYDLILMDKMMPGMDGIETTVAIRAGEGGVLDPEIPIVALTAEVSVEARRECLNSGMNDYLAKPIRKAEIDPVIRAWLPPHLRPARKAG